ncbi:MAG: GNAT family N-acetyltransferase [Planctomycetota bacterium]
MERIFDTLEPIEARMHRLREIAITCSPLAVADPEETALVYQAGVGVHRAEAVRRLTADDDAGFLYEVSQVALLKGRVIGFILIRRGQSSEAAVVDSLTVLPEHRGSPAHMLLMLCAARAARHWCTTVEYLAGEHHASTLKFAHWTSADVIDVRHRYVLLRGDLKRNAIHAG